MAQRRPEQAQYDPPAAVRKFFFAPLPGGLNVQIRSTRSRLGLRIDASMSWGNDWSKEPHAFRSRAPQITEVKNGS
jgi:hypothetical protein